MSKKPADLEEGVTEQTSLLGSLKSPRLAELATATASKLNSQDDTCIIKYDPIHLTSLSTLATFSGSAFMQSAVWKVVFVVIVLTATTAVGVVKGIEHFDEINPESFSTETISSVIRSVNLAMSFLLGLFVNNAITRWWGIIKDLENLMGSAEKLILMLIHSGATPQMREQTLRRVLLAIEMLRYNKVVEFMPGEKELNWSKKFDAMVNGGNMTNEERDAMEFVLPEERPIAAWALCSKAIQPIDDENPRASVHVYKVVQEGVNSTQALTTAASFMFPFLYTHLLAFMVHLVNILTSLCAGVTIGIVIARSRVPQSVSGKMAPQMDGSAIFKEVLFLFIQVFLYQSFLGIGAALSYPVVPRGHGAMYRVPFEEMIGSLRAKLERINRMADEGKV